jgi:hypothetical protein
MRHSNPAYRREDFSMSSSPGRRVVRGVSLFAVGVFSLFSGGCASPGQIAVGLVGVPFEVAKFTATQTATLPIAAAEIGARGVVGAVFR